MNNLFQRILDIDKRDNEKDYQNYNFKHYEYNLSHCRSLARVASGSNTQYFQGSSLLRKKKPENVREDLQSEDKNALQLLVEANNRKQKANKIRSGIELYKAKYVDGKSMSRRTKIKVKEKMLAMYAASSKKFTFQTLTFVNSVTDREGIKCLNKYLTVLRKKNGLFNYIWVAEKQLKKTNNIHFHLMIDRRLDITEINSLWVCQQLNAGIINSEAALKLYNEYGLTFKQAHKKGFFYQRIIQSYLNPVDIKPVNSLNGLSTYLTNYVIKNESKICGSVWHCSKTISKLFTKQLISKKTFDSSCSGKINRVYSKKKKKMYINKTFVHQYGMINNIFNKKYFNTYLKEMNLINTWILSNEKITGGDEITEYRYREILYGSDSYGNNETPSIKPFYTTKQIIEQLQYN